MSATAVCPVSKKAEEDRGSCPLLKYIYCNDSVTVTVPPDADA